MKVLITGGAGFVGSLIARSLKRREPTWQITAFDNLKRRGGELNVPILQKEGISFVHGDVRSKEDLEDLEGSFDIFVEASAEPSVHAGVGGSPAYLLETNLVGALNCFEFARRRVGRTFFLSSSRVYSLDPLKAIKLEEKGSRLTPAVSDQPAGFSSHGISERFPVDTARSLYGATKLTAEYIAQEYVATFQSEIVINRCGVMAGPGQFGKVDQGVYTLWVAHHYFGLPLKYQGFGGKGLQVRDILHPEDLVELMLTQLKAPAAKACGRVFNVGGGNMNAVSLAEYTALCQKATGRSVDITSVPTTAAVDVPYIVMDHRAVSQEFNWQPQRSSEKIVTEIASWIDSNAASLKPLFCR